MTRLFNSLQFRVYIILAFLTLLFARLVQVNIQTSNENARAQQVFDAAGRQRSNAYLLASLARRLIGASDAEATESIIALIRTTIENTEQIEVGLRFGDETLGISPITEPEILSLLDQLDIAWAEYDSLLRSFIAPDSTGRASLIPHIDNQSVVVYTFSDRLVSGLNTLLQQRIQGRQQLLIVLVVVVLVIMTISVLVIVQAVGSIDKLAHTAREFAKGNLQARADQRAVVEVAQVGQVFNSMAGQIGQLITDLEQRATEAQRARDQAEQSDKVKSAFLASMSHELRTPLNAIINFSKFVARGDLGYVNEQQEETLNDVVDSAKHLLNLINDVLDMSKIESGTLNLFVSNEIDLKAVINQGIAAAKGLLADKPIELKTDIVADLPYIRGDKQRIVQILLNMLSNACKFTEEGSITVTARIKPAQGEVLISVADTGPGIPPEDQASVFEAFRQTKSGLRQGGGTGLGMPISKNLAEAHGGRLWLESEAGKGATFYVALPIKSDKLEPTLVTRPLSS